MNTEFDDFWRERANECWKFWPAPETWPIDAYNRTYEAKQAVNGYTKIQFSTVKGMTEHRIYKCEKQPAVRRPAVFTPEQNALRAEYTKAKHESGLPWSLFVDTPRAKELQVALLAVGLDYRNTSKNNQNLDA